MSNNQGDKPNKAEVIKNGNLNIQSLGEVGNNFVPLVETEYNTITTHTETELILRGKFMKSLLIKAEDICNKYGSLERLEQRMIEAEKEVSLLQETVKDRECHVNFLSEKRTDLQENCDRQSVQITALEKRVKELEEAADLFLKEAGKLKPNVNVDSVKDMSFYNSYHALKKLLTPKQ